MCQEGYFYLLDALNDGVRLEDIKDHIHACEVCNKELKKIFNCYSRGIYYPYFEGVVIPAGIKDKESLLEVIKHSFYQDRLMSTQ